MTMEPQAIDDTLLVSFADGELDPVTEQLVAEQVSADPVLAARVEMFRRTAIQLRAALSSPDQLRVPDALLANVSRLIDGKTPVRRDVFPGPQTGKGLLGRRPDRASRFARSLWLPAAAAAAVAGFMLGGANLARYMPFGGGASGAAVAHVLEEVADYHGVFALEQEHLVEVRADRKAHIESWLGSRVKLAFQVPDLAGYDLTFQGARMLAVDRRPVAQLIYTGKDGVPVALCIALAEEDTRVALQGREDGETMLYGRGEGRHIFIVAGPRGNASLRAIAEAMPALLRRS